MLKKRNNKVSKMSFVAHSLSNSIIDDLPKIFYTDLGLLLNLGNQSYSLRLF